MRKMLLAGAGLVGAVLAVGCGPPERQNAHQTKDVERSGWDRVYAAPDHFSNVAERCDDYGHRIFITSNKGDDASKLVVMEDSTCKVNSGRLDRP